MEQVTMKDGESRKAQASRALAAGRDNDPQVLRMLRLGFRILDKTAPGLGGRWAYWLWFRTRRYPEPRREQQLRSTARRISMEYAGNPLAVYVWGEGPTVLLAHGWNGRATQFWRFIDPLVKAGYRVVAFDQPAHGQSAGKSTDLYRIAESLGLVAREFEPLHGVIAHSVGNAALVMALGGGLSAGKVVCISAPAQSTLMLKNYADALELSSSMQERLERLFLKDYGADVWKQTSAVDNVGTLSIPVLVIHDKDDHEVPWKEGELIAQNWPDAEFVLTETLGHRRILRDRGVVARAVEFLVS